MSSRSLALRFFSSGPWHKRQFSLRIGRISRLKSTFRSSAPPAKILAGEARTIKPLNSRGFAIFIRIISVRPGTTKFDIIKALFLQMRQGIRKRVYQILEVDATSLPEIQAIKSGENV